MNVAVVGVDPGAEHTGIVLTLVGERAGQLHLLTHRTVHRDQSKGGVLPVDDEYITRVLVAIDTTRAISEADRVVVGVEGVRAPQSHIHGKPAFIDPEPLIAAGFLAGVIMGAQAPKVDGLYLVDPGGNGAGVYAAYPDGLVTTAERRAANWKTRPAGQGNLRHVRSAFDVARRAEQLDRKHRRQG